VQIDQANFSTAVDATLVDDVHVTVHDLRFGAEHAHDDFRLVEPGWAGAVLGRAFARTDLIPSTEVAHGFAGTRALALARVRALPTTPDSLPLSPEPTQERRDAVVAEFRQSPEAADLFTPNASGRGASVLDAVVQDASARDASVRDAFVPDASARDADQVARLIVDFAVSRDPGELIRVSPARWEAFLEATSPGDVDAVFADVVRAWSAWASRQSGMPLLARDELATALDEMLDEYLPHSPRGPRTYG
jgi:hypothetical protein